MSPTGAGVTGAPAAKVHFRTGKKCRLPHDVDKLQTALGKPPDISWEVGNLHRGWTDGITYRHQEVAQSEDRRETTYLEKQLNWLHPGGVVAIDPATITSSGEIVPYAVLPYAAGAVQLEREGILVPVTRAEIDAWTERAKIQQGKGLVENLGIRGTAYRVTRPTRVPAGLCGSHSLTFFVPSREYLTGDWCHSDVLALDGRILAPSNFAIDPHCGSRQFTAFAQPHAPGPLRLRDIKCTLTFLANAHASPDGKQIAFFPSDDLLQNPPLRVQPLTGNPSPRRDLPVKGAPYSNKPFWQPTPTFAWRADSQAIWAVTPQSIPGMKRTSLQPILVKLDGSIDTLPAVKHESGPVESMIWVGGSGKAFAQFRGDPFDPVTHKVRPPTFGMVDARAGVVLDTFGPAAYETLRRSNPDLKEFFYPNRVVATQRPDGQMHALMALGPWVSWRQHQEPRIFRDLPQASHAVMSADGKSVLLLRAKLPGEDNEAWIIHCDGDEEGGRHGPCPKREAKEGTWASLHDLDTGKMLWALRWTFDRYDRLTEVGLSPDGKLALIPLFSRTDRYQTFIALVSMRDGKILQTVPTPPNAYSAGFTDGGGTVWISSLRGTLFYSVQ